MENAVTRQTFKYGKAMYVMVSVPEAIPENVRKEPVVLGAYLTKEDAKAAWKARSPEYKTIKARTVHVYGATLQTNASEIPETVYLTAVYNTANMGDTLDFSFYPGDLYPDMASVIHFREWRSTQETIPFRELCADCGWTYYASNEDICVACPVNRLMMAAVPLE